MIERAKAGDARAFAAIYHAYAALVFSVALRISRVWQDAEEITQEVFLTLFRKFSQFNFLSSLKTWLYRIAVNTALNARRGHLREEARRLVYQKSAILGRGAVTDPAAQVEAEAEANALLDLLPPEQRVCLVLRTIEGLSYQEIAEVLQININTVRSRLKRGRETLLAWKQGEAK
ncbi:MAG: RNA polymerase sigma factor RpoE [Candidatus Ozemobacter sibiricus]|uniref:RNA polymerase sigma factor RpoE n=1 Tax=Candidatus Ozemobacter sibiricus TaxID=2268124 RepID=A0A367ZQJ3_9BACT|nr:MAG: RNA polymerase sigma factor RpoE [Candidatus Ozemobacter sibiricus]